MNFTEESHPTTKDLDVVTTTEFSITRPNDWWEFFPRDYNECFQLFGKVVYYFNLTAADFRCICMGITISCREDWINEEEAEKAIENTLDAIVTLRLFENIESFISVIFFYSLVGAAGIIGNIFLLVTLFFFMPPGNVTNVFIANLAVGDLLVLSVSLPFKAYEIYRWVWFLDFWVCHVMFFLFWLCFMVSVFTMTAMAVERYLAICHPMKAQYISSVSRSRKICVAIWLVAGLLTIPLTYIIKESKDRGICRIHDGILGGKIVAVYVCIVSFLIPLCVMTVAYGRAGYVLYGSIAEARRLQGTSDNPEARNKQDESSGRLQVVRMLVIVLVIFILSWTPMIIFFLLKAFRVVAFQYGLSMSQDQTITLVTTLLTYLSSALNPILYAFLSKQIRRGYIRCLKCGKAGRYEDKRSPVSGVTRSTGEMSLSASVATKGSIETNESLVTNEPIPSTSTAQ